MELPWSKGPTLKTLGPLRRWRVYYRYRPFGEPDWKVTAIVTIARSEPQARRNIAKWISERTTGRVECEIRKVVLLPAEVEIQDGGKVEVVSEKEYEERQAKELESAGGQAAVEDRLRELGMWIPEKKP